MVHKNYCINKGFHLPAGTSTGTWLGTDLGIWALFGSGVSVRFFQCKFHGSSVCMRKSTKPAGDVLMKWDEVVEDLMSVSFGKMYLLSSA